MNEITIGPVTDPQTIHLLPLGVAVKIVSAACLCGGKLAWMQQRPNGTWEFVGCCCHTFIRASALAPPEVTERQPSVMVWSGSGHPQPERAER